MKQLRQIISILLKLGVAIAVLGYLLNKMGLDQLGHTLKATAREWPWLLAGLTLCLIALLIGMARWKTILDAQGMKLDWLRVNTIFSAPPAATSSRPITPLRKPITKKQRP
jgi:uncharacterized membrane protein YbhN (UPF0104 family)